MNIVKRIFFGLVLLTSLSAVSLVKADLDFIPTAWGSPSFLNVVRGISVDKVSKDAASLGYKLAPEWSVSVGPHNVVDLWNWSIENKKALTFFFAGMLALKGIDYVFETYDNWAIRRTKSLVQQAKIKLESLRAQ